MANALQTKAKNKTIFIAPDLLFKKKHKSLIASQVYKQNSTNLGPFTFGIKALEYARITPKQN